MAKFLFWFAKNARFVMFNKQHVHNGKIVVAIFWNFQLTFCLAGQDSFKILPCFFSLESWKLKTHVKFNPLHISNS